MLTSVPLPSFLQAAFACREEEEGLLVATSFSGQNFTGFERDGWESRVEEGGGAVLSCVLRSLPGWKKEGPEANEARPGNKA